MYGEGRFGADVEQQQYISNSSNNYVILNNKNTFSLNKTEMFYIQIRLFCHFRSELATRIKSYVWQTRQGRFFNVLVHSILKYRFIIIFIIVIGISISISNSIIVSNITTYN